MMKTSIMTVHSDCIRNERGSLMFVVLLIMAALTIAGVMVTDDAVTESQVGRNYSIHQQSVNVAEGAAKQMIQALDSVFLDAANGSEAIGDLDGNSWEPHDGTNVSFDFDAANWSSYNVKPSDLQTALGHITEAGAIAVLINQNTAAMTPGLGGSKVPEQYDYLIYGRSVHAGAGGSDTILMIGYRQEKLKG